MHTPSVLCSAKYFSSKVNSSEFKELNFYNASKQAVWPLSLYCVSDNAGHDQPGFRMAHKAYGSPNVFMDQATVAVTVAKNHNRHGQFS